MSYQRKNYGNGPRNEMSFDEIISTLADLKVDMKDYDGEYILSHIDCDEKLSKAQKIFNQDLIVSSGNYHEFKAKCDLLKLEEELEKLNNQNKKLKKENKKLKKINDELINSTSWKMTEPLRKLRNLK